MARKPAYEMALKAYNEYKGGKDRSTVTMSLVATGGKMALFEFGQIEHQALIREKKSRLQKAA